MNLRDKVIWESMLVHYDSLEKDKNIVINEIKADVENYTSCRENKTQGLRKMAYAGLFITDEEDVAQIVQSLRLKGFGVNMNKKESLLDWYADEVARVGGENLWK